MSGLPGRGALLAAAARAGEPCVLVAVRTDEAAAIRAKHGDSVAERLAARLAEALAGAAGPDDAVGRLGPDTAGVLVGGPRAADPAALLARFHAAAQRASRAPVRAGAASTADGGLETLLERAEAALAAAGGGRALLEGGAQVHAAPAAAAPESLASRYQRLVLLNRVALTVFAARRSEAELAEAVPYLLAVSGARAVRVSGPRGVVAAGGEKALEGGEADALHEEAAGAARAASAPAWREDRSAGWQALPLSVAGEAADSTISFAYPAGRRPGGELSLILGDVARLVEAALRAREIDRLKDEFVALVTHDLRTPLTSIRGFADALLTYDERLPDPERRRFAGVILREAKRMGRMVDDFLDLERLASGRVDLRREPVALRPVAERVAETLRGYGPAVRFEVDVPEDLPRPAADAEQVERVLVNLGSNAVKYSPEGGVVRIAARRVDGTVEVSVSDQGPGVPPEARRSLFEKFFRAKDSVSARVKGSGLGLAAAKAIVEAHGGSIRCEDAPGGGASFVFTLPVQ